MTPTIHPPASWPNITRRPAVEIGRENGQTDGFEIRLDVNTYLWSTQRAAGMSNLLRTIAVAASALPDTVVFVVDPDQKADITRPLIRKWLAGEQDTGEPDPVIDWVAPDLAEAVHMMHALGHMAHTRQSESGYSQVVVIVAAGDSGLFGTGDSNDKTQLIEDHIAKIMAAGKVGINFVIASNKQPSFSLKAEIGLRIDQVLLVGPAPDSQIVSAFGAEAADSLKHNGAGDAMYSGWEHPGRVSHLRLYLLPERRQDEAVRRGWLDSVSHTDFYFCRWLRVLPKITSDDEIPHHLHSYGMPVLDKDPGNIPVHTLQWALHRSPSATHPAADAAVMILTETCGGELLESDKVRNTFYVEDGEIYVRWPQLAIVADRLECGGPGYYRHPDVPIMLRVAAHLATGGFTPDSLDRLGPIIETVQE